VIGFIFQLVLISEVSPLCGYFAGFISAFQCFSVSAFSPSSLFGSSKIHAGNSNGL
jgi:hypothetical protein